MSIFYRFDLFFGNRQRFFFNSLQSRRSHEQLKINGFIELNITDDLSLLEEKNSTNSQNSIGVGLVGRWHRMKGFGLFYSRVRPNNKYSYTHYSNSLIAKNKLGTEWCDLLNVVTGVTDKDEIYSSMDVLVVTSIFGESMPNIIFESIARGVPVLWNWTPEIAQFFGPYGFYTYPLKDKIDFDRLLASGAPFGLSELLHNQKKCLERFINVRFEY